MSADFWVLATITSVSAFVSLGYSLSALRGSVGVANTNARYAFSRSLALALAVTVVLFTQSPPWLRAVAFAMILVQAGDAVVGAGLQDRLKTLGPAVTALVNLVALILLSR